MNKRFYKNKLLNILILGFLMLSSIPNAFGGNHYGKGSYGNHYGKGSYGSHYGKGSYGSHYGKGSYGSHYGGGYYYGGYNHGWYWFDVIAPIVTIGAVGAMVYALTPPPAVIVQQPVVVPQTVYVPQENFPQTNSRQMPASVVINIPNSNGSYTPVTLWKSFDGYVGPQGEYYPGRPTVEQLKVLYGR